MQTTSDIGHWGQNIGACWSSAGHDMLQRAEQTAAICYGSHCQSWKHLIQVCVEWVAGAEGDVFTSPTVRLANFCTVECAHINGHLRGQIRVSLLLRKVNILPTARAEQGLERERSDPITVVNPVQTDSGLCLHGNMTLP